MLRFACTRSISALDLPLPSPPILPSTPSPDKIQSRRRSQSFSPEEFKDANKFGFPSLQSPVPSNLLPSALELSATRSSSDFHLSSYDSPDEMTSLLERKSPKRFASGIFKRFSHPKKVSAPSGVNEQWKLSPPVLITIDQSPPQLIHDPGGENGIVDQTLAVPTLNACGTGDGLITGGV